MRPDPETTELNPNWPAPVQALWWLKKGGLVLGDEWDRAHTICQSNEGDRDHDWVHALAHWIEGDEANANFWYRNCAKSRTGSTVSEEWAAIADALTGAKA